MEAKKAAEAAKLEKQIDSLIKHEQATNPATVAIGNTSASTTAMLPPAPPLVQNQSPGAAQADVQQQSLQVSPPLEQLENQNTGIGTGKNQSAVALAANDQEQEQRAADVLAGKDPVAADLQFDKEKLRQACLVDGYSEQVGIPQEGDAAMIKEEFAEHEQEASPDHGALADHAAQFGSAHEDGAALTLRAADDDDDDDGGHLPQEDSVLATAEAAAETNQMAGAEASPSEAAENMQVDQAAATEVFNPDAAEESEHEPQAITAAEAHADKDMRKAAEKLSSEQEDAEEAARKAEIDEELEEMFGDTAHKLRLEQQTEAATEATVRAQEEQQGQAATELQLQEALAEAEQRDEEEQQRQAYEEQQLQQKAAAEAGHTTDEGKQMQAARTLDAGQESAIATAGAAAETQQKGDDTEKHMPLAELQPAQASAADKGEQATSAKKNAKTSTSKDSKPSKATTSKGEAVGATAIKGKKRTSDNTATEVTASKSQSSASQAKKAKLVWQQPLKFG